MQLKTVETSGTATDDTSKIFAPASAHSWRRWLTSTIHAILQIHRTESQFFLLTNVLHQAEGDATVPVP